MMHLNWGKKLFAFSAIYWSEAVFLKMTNALSSVFLAELVERWIMLKTSSIGLPGQKEPMC